MLRRQCTQDFKLIPIHRQVRKLLGLKPRQRGGKVVAVEQWIGISIDEASRMKPSRHAYIRHRWPLIEREMSRRGCLEWMAAHGYGQPPKSACTFCPYHNDAMWQQMRRDDSASWDEAVKIDQEIRHGVKDRTKGRRISASLWYLHRSCVPLDQVVFNKGDKRQINLFENECEGLCGN